ncbi:MAG TPA: P-loop NTPase fold protein, partial [Candidatus Kapabacteria bacterium]|nr:P-loop NTPase fold protein [Candidatus Kapabacteria bacterium]
MAVKKAGNLEEFDSVLDIHPLNDINYDAFYVDTTAGRGENPTKTLIRQMGNNQAKNFKILFAGFKGCGKSTELLRLKRELDDHFIIHIFSVLEKLDPNNFSISELMISITTELLVYVQKYHDTMKLSPELEKKLADWSKKTVNEEISYNYAERHTGAGVDINAGLGKILNFFAKLSFDFQNGRKFTEISSIETEKTLSDLILHCNLIVAEIKNQLDTIGKKNIIIIVDDLEKVNPAITEKLFFNYSKQLTAIACSFIFTFPIALVFNPMYNIIINEFDQNLVLPMIKVHDKEWKDYKQGIDCILTLLDRRIDQAAGLISIETLQEFIRMSGGSLRDLFRMIKLAAENALDYGR